MTKQTEAPGMPPGFDRYLSLSRDATAGDPEALSLADVAAWEAQREGRRGRDPMSPWWWLAIGAVLVAWVIGLGYVFRMGWEMVG